MSIELRLDDDDQIVCDYGVITNWGDDDPQPTVGHLWLVNTTWIAHALHYGEPFWTIHGVAQVVVVGTAAYLHLVNDDGYYIWELHPVRDPDGHDCPDMMLGVWRD